MGPRLPMAIVDVNGGHQRGYRSDYERRVTSGGVSLGLVNEGHTREVSLELGEVTPEVSLDWWTEVTVRPEFPFTFI